MISIIIVGKNEGWRLSKSINSAHALISYYPKLEFDIIYVDSLSTDDSISRAKLFSLTRIFEITGETNSAIARNIGAKESKGDILFFVDADMEIQLEFLGHALNERDELKFDYLTGHLDDYFYTMGYEFIESAPRTYKDNIPINNQELNQNGGLFIINKRTWNEVGGMKNNYRRSQDLDLTIRLKRKGIKIIRIPYLAAKHHTIDYRNEKRMWKMLWQGNNLYPGLIFRNHLLNMHVIKRVLRAEYTALLLFIFFLSLFFSTGLIVFTGGLYLIVLILRILLQSKKAKTKKNKILYFYERIPFQILSDLSFWIGFLFFFPKNKNLQYKLI